MGKVMYPSSTPMSRPAPLILVVGMHRSGTSLLGSILKALGVAMPGTMIPGDHHNPEGYFERFDITCLQEELLIDMQRWWPSEEGTLPLPRDWLLTQRSQRVATCLLRLLKEDIQKQQSTWAIKDPRSSLLLPLWRQVAGELNLPLRLLLAFRDPQEVVTSLVTRDAASTGMTAERAQALWLRHHQQLITDAKDLPLHVVSYSRWFDSPQEQLQGLQSFCLPQCNDPTAISEALACIKPEYRRSQSNYPTLSLNRQVKRCHQILERAAKGSEPHLRRWAERHGPMTTEKSTLNKSLALESHPWSRALIALGSNSSIARSAGIQAWEQHGISAISLAQLKELNHPGFPGLDPSSSSGALLPKYIKLALIGGTLDAWTSHLWINLLPLSSDCTLVSCSPETATQAVLHIQPLDITAQNPSLLLHLTQVERVFDPNPEQVKLLRLLGVNAENLQNYHLQHGDGQGTWLESTHLTREATTQLGLPNPEALMAIGGRWLCLGKGEGVGWDALPPNLLHLPVFPPAPSLSRKQAKLLAAWIQACLMAGLNLTRLKPSEQEKTLWDILSVPYFQRTINPHELIEELDWRKAGLPSPEVIQTPAPEAELIWELTTQHAPDVSICISSHNYAARISAALESCFAQSLEAIELLIVDDASTDDSLNQCRLWLEIKGHRFCQVKLLKHCQNGGLASARNTAFANATAPWCWVLDADNQLDPKACEACIQLARASSDRTAVVHPLIRVCDENGQNLGLAGGGHAWQREQLKAGNVVDAMALIRHEAWKSVGGYSHIHGGWEDFDFWCKLIEDDWHGVLFPQPLATYTKHANSMLQSQTNQRQRKLSRLLQQRHPWLQLAFAAKNS